MPIQFVRFRTAGDVCFGVLEHDVVHEMEGGLFARGVRTGRTLALADVALLPPCEPSKIIGVGLNYRSHLAGRKEPESPELFYKPPSSLIGPGEAIVIPHGATDVHFEGELVLVIGRRLRSASRDEAAAAIFGVTCGNDVSDRGWQRGEHKDLQWWRAKGCDTFAPLGPAIVTGLDFNSLPITTRVNGVVAQDGSTSDLIHDCASVVSYASQWITLLPGDLIYTGTPGNTFALKPGDVVEVEIAGVGVLSNPVR